MIRSLPRNVLGGIFAEWLSLKEMSLLFLFLFTADRRLLNRLCFKHPIIGVLKPEYYAYFFLMLNSSANTIDRKVAKYKLLNKIPDRILTRCRKDLPNPCKVFSKNLSAELESFPATLENMDTNTIQKHLYYLRKAIYFHFNLTGQRLAIKEHVFHFYYIEDVYAFNLKRIKALESSLTLPTELQFSAFKNVMNTRNIKMLDELIEANIILSPDFYRDLINYGTTAIQIEYKEQQEKFREGLILTMSILLGIFFYGSIACIVCESLGLIKQEKLYLASFIISIITLSIYALLVLSFCLDRDNFIGKYCTSKFNFLFSTFLHPYLGSIDRLPTESFLLKVIELLKEKGMNASEEDTANARRNNWGSKLVAALEDQQPQQSLFWRCRYSSVTRTDNHDIEAPLIPQV